MWPAVGIPRGTFSHGKGGATGHQRSGFGILNPKTGQRLKADLDALSQDIPTAALGATVARILLIISGIIAIVVRQFFPGSDLPPCDNPDGVRRFLDFTVWVTRMIDIPCGIVQCLAINRVPVREMKDVGIASGYSPRAFSARHLLSDVLHDPRTIGSI